MVAGLGLLPFFLSYALCLHIVALDWVSAAVGSQNVRTRRSDFGFPYTSNSSTSFPFGDRMLEDEANAEESIQEKLVVRGQVVILECLERDPSRTSRQNKVKDTHSDAAVRWFQNDKEVSPNLRVTWSVTGRLRISHAVSGDSGVWRCRKGGFLRRPLRLIVTIPPERPFLVYGGAQLAEGARLTTRAGNSLALHCVVEGGNPAPSIQWFLNDKEITANSSIRSEWRGPEDQFASVSNVTLSKVVKEHHNASVVCRVIHAALSRPHAAHLNLNIEYPPDFRLRRWPVWGSPLREGSSVSLLCHVDANPLSLPSWIKEADGKETEMGVSDGWLNLTSVTAKNRGWYKCSTDHSFGRFSSHSVYINVLPALNISRSGNGARTGASKVSSSSEQAVGGVVGGPSQIHPNPRQTNRKSPCTVPPGGPPSLCWRTSSTSQEDESEGPITQQYPLRQRDRPPAVENEPIRNCPPTAEENSDISNRFIWKSDIKIKVMNRTHAALEGGPAMLTAHVCGSPVASPHVTWLPPSRATAIAPGKAFGRWTAFNLSSPDSQKCVLSNLHIVPVQGVTDAGTWVILVANAHSAHAALVRLNVSAAAKSLAAATAEANSSPQLYCKGENLLRCFLSFVMLSFIFRKSVH